MATTVIAGVPGVGLTTITERARRQLDASYELINFGDIMLEYAAANDWATRREELQDLSRRQTRRLQRRAGEFIADLDESDEILLTTHFAVETETGFLHGLPDAVLRDVNPHRFVLVEADPGTIQSRRDSSDRDYGESSTLSIDFEQDVNRTAAFEYAHTVDAPISLIENEGDVDEAAANLANIL